MSKTAKSLPSLSRGKSSYFLLHFIFTSIYAFTIYRVYTGIAIPVHKPQGKLLGPFKYLTIWNLHFQFLASFLNALVVLTDCKRIVSLRNAVHHGLSVPFGLSVLGLFWSLYLVDRRLIFPKELDAIIPPLINHFLHTVVGLTPLINEFIDYNERKSNHFLIYITVQIAYLCNLLFFGYYIDYWIYPIFEVLNDVGRFIFLIFSIALGVLVFSTHGALHNYLWADKVKIMKIKMKKKL